MFDLSESGGRESCLLAYRQCEGITNDILSISGNINVSNQD